MEKLFEVNHSLVKKYRKTFLNTYCWFLLIIFLFNIGLFIYKGIQDSNFFSIYYFIRTFIPSGIGYGLFVLLKSGIEKHKNITYLYLGSFLFSIYSFEFLLNYHNISMSLPGIILLASIFLLDKKIIKTEMKVILFTNLLYLCILFAFGHNLFNLIISYFFGTIITLFVTYISLVVINFLSDFMSINQRALRTQEILQQNINKAVNDLKIEPMTKLFNKATMYEAMDVKINNFNQKGIEAYVAVLDIDFFKKVNDNYGHDVGDKVLIELANCLRTKLDKKANAFRFGGEEFVILFDKYSESEVYEILEDIRVTFGSKIFKYMDNKNVTLSMGYTKVRKNDTKETFLKRADEALYKSKENGRNQINKN